jgi:GTPase SAR1 family protein
LNVIFVVGMAGSGKSLLTASLQELLRLRRQNVVVLNLDPGAQSLPYTADVDVRTYVDIENLMTQYRLGPNGALIMATDLVGEYIEEIKGEIDESGTDLLLVDTPGQMELFAFRESGFFISKALGDEQTTVLYLFDAPFCRNPLNYVSNMFIATAIYSRLTLPQVYALTKTDLITPEELQGILLRSETLDSLEYEIEAKLSATTSVVIRDLARSIAASGLEFDPVPVSAKENTGLIDLYAELTRVATQGEEPTQ